MNERDPEAPQGDLIPHLFRTEYGKIVAVLSRYFGFSNIEAAEDIASETFLSATQSWGPRGVPPNPAAWLYTVAKNKAKNYLARQQRFRRQVEPQLQSAAEREAGGHDTAEIDLGDQNVMDSQLRLMFALCHPCIAAEAHIALALRLLCGFGIDEIADAFLTTKIVINKRLLRAKEKLRNQGVGLELPEPAEIERRLHTVLMTIYLLFNEGYYSKSNPATVRRDLCLEAVRLCHLLVMQNSTDTPAANALLALMCFHASRLDARTAGGRLVLYGAQDPGLWNKDLIAKGGYYLSRASRGDKLSRFHLEAGIAFWHTIAGDTSEKWENILYYYNRLLQIEYSPIAALNRSYALAKARGPAVAIPETEKLGLDENHLYFALLGELYKTVDPGAALRNFQRALSLARTPADKAGIMGEIERLSALL